jgi:membrane associated rhomboid family serine protease
VNVAVFALELALGGSDSPATLERMGAGLGRAGMVHEPWRMVSSAFLHFDVLHLAFNMWALVAFGRMLEIVLGPRRFVVLYALSAAGGGLASALFHAQVLSAGASGAVWGLMTGQIAAIVRLKRQEGEQRVAVRTSALLQPLVVNLLYSLTPGIDMAGHLGGGMAGAAAIFSGLVGWARPESPRWRPAAWFASLSMAGCLAVAVAQGRPWELLWPPPMVPRTVADTPLTVPVPRGLEPDAAGEGKGVSFGDLSRDPLVVFCAAGRLDTPLPEPQWPAFLAQAAQEIAAPPLERGSSWEQRPHVVRLRDRQAVFATSRIAGGPRVQTWIMTDGSWWLRLDVLLRPDASRGWTRLPSAIADGVAFGSRQ